LQALELARAAFPRISFDLIYARPEQSEAAWLAELDEALALGPEHISLYQLTIEENTAFHGAWRRGELVLPEPDAAAELYERTALQLAAAGLPGYEISNTARRRPGSTWWRSRVTAGAASSPSRQSSAWPRW
jgi:oxygen-independent coproporphyrinogen-3 oxidase